MKKVKGFSYDPVKDKDVINHLNTLPNFSYYILDLIRKDMRKESIDAIIEKKIQKYLEGMEMQKKEMSTNMNIDKDSLLEILEL